MSILLNCFESCPYLVARNKALLTTIAVMNYAYFLTTIQNPFSTFQPRTLTICDECHLLPTIVNDLFNFDLNSYRLQLNRIVERDKIDRDLAEKIIKSQLSNEERIKKADVVIENNSSLEDLFEKVERFCERI